MKPTTSTYKQIIASGNTRNFLVRIVLTLADNTNRTLTNADIMEDTFKIVTASSGTTSFDLGSAVIGLCQFSIENFDERFTEYDFFNASAVVWLKLVGDSEYHRMGFFTVEEPEFAGAIVTFELLDNMWKFDIPLEEAGLSYPCDAYTAVSKMCTACGVTLASNFGNSDYVLTEAPEEEMNCREYLQYIAMITCNFCVCNSEGNLVLKWYTIADRPADELDGGTFDTNTTPYSDGDNADGGNFTDYTSGDDYDGGTFLELAEIPSFTRNFSLSVGTDEIEITGIKFVINDTEYQIGNDGYVLTLENPLVNEGNVSDVLRTIWSRLSGFRLRTFSLKTLPDIACEVGDRCNVKDLKGNILQTSITYLSIGLSSMDVHCDAESVSRTLTKRYSKTVKTSVEEARKATDEKISAYDVAVQSMNNLAIHALGAYQDYEDLVTGGRVYYLSSKPLTKDSNGKIWLTENAPAFKTTGEGLFVSQTGTTDPDTRTWVNGYNLTTGELIVNVLYTIGLHADWIVAGLLKSANYAYTSGDYSTAGTMFDVANGVIKSKNFAIDENGVVHIASTAVIGDATASDLVTSTELSTAGQTTINGGNITTGIIKGANNKFSLNMNTGAVSMNDASFQGTITGSRISNGNGTFVVEANGSMTAQSGTIGNFTLGNGALYANKVIYFATDKKKTASSKKLYTTSIASFVPKTCGVVSNFTINLDYTVTTSYSRGMTAKLQRVNSDGSATDITGQSYSMNTSGSGTINFTRSFDYTETTKYRVAVEFEAKASGSYLQKITCSLYTSTAIGTAVSADKFVGRLESPNAVIGGITIDAESMDCLTNSRDGFRINNEGIAIKNNNRYLLASGDVGVFTEDIIDGLYVASTASDNTGCIYIYQDSSNNLILYNSGAYVYKVNGTSHSGTLGGGSDRRIKEDITDLDKELSKSLIDNTITHKFKYIKNDGYHYGVIAQEARELLDSLGEKEARLEYIAGTSQIPDQRAVAYDEYIPHLINYVKDLRAEIDTLKAEIKTLKGEN